MGATESLTETNAEINERAALENMEADFEASFIKRQEKFEASLRDYDRRLEDKRNQYNALSKEVVRLQERYRNRAEASAEEFDSVAAQVANLMLNMDGEELENLLQSQPQLWSRI